MKKIAHITLLLLAFSVIMSSCTSTSPRDKEATQISQLEDDLKAMTTKPDQQQINNLLQMYIDFVDHYPDDSASTVYLYDAVNLSMGMNDGKKAMELVDRTLNEYPKSPRIAESVFLKGYIYENLLGNYGLATSTYSDFIKRFPDHELADDAQAAIENMGKTPDELIREFEARNAAGV